MVLLFTFFKTNPWLTSEDSKSVLKKKKKHKKKLNYLAGIVYLLAF